MPLRPSLVDHLPKRLAHISSLEEFTKSCASILKSYSGEKNGWHSTAATHMGLWPSAPGFRRGRRGFRGGRGSPKAWKVKWMHHQGGYSVGVSTRLDYQP